MNHVILIGYVGAAPEVRRTKNDKLVCSFSLATSRTGKSKERATSWHKVIVWERQAELCATYVSKGSKVAVAGRLQTRAYEDKDGRRRVVTEIIAHLVNFLEPRQESKRDNSVLGQAEKRALADDDIPF